MVNGIFCGGGDDVYGDDVLKMVNGIFHENVLSGGVYDDDDDDDVYEEDVLIVLSGRVYDVCDDVCDDDVIDIF